MSDRIRAPQVGAPDPEGHTSFIIEESDYDYDLLGQEAVELPLCYFNGTAYQHGAYVCSGDELLHCEKGFWVRSGSCDTVNP